MKKPAATLGWLVAALVVTTATRQHPGHAVALAASPAKPAAADAREQAYRENNRGVALLEQFRPEDAAAAFRHALGLDPQLALARVNLAIALLNVPEPEAAEREVRLAVVAKPDSPQAHYVRGLLARARNENAEAKAAFERVLALDPKDVGANVNLGQLLLQEKNYAAAMAAFRVALDAEPHNASAAYNLGLALTRSGQAEDGQRMMERFRLLRESGYAKVLGQGYPEQGRYAEAVASTGAETDLVDTATPAVRFVDATAEVLPSKAAAASSSQASAPAALVLFDFDGDGDLDLFDVSAGGQHLYRNDGHWVDVTTQLGLDPTQAGIGAIAGDIDNDTRPDLVVLRAGGVTLHRNTTDRGFVDSTASAGLGSVGATASAALADFDHDGDLDLLLAGSGGPDRLFQNAGDATFKDVAVAAGIAIPAKVLSVVPTDFDNGRDMDLLEIQDGGPARLFRNLRDGRFKDVAADVGLPAATTLRSVAVADVNKDSYSDFFFGSAEGDLLALSDGRGRFNVLAVPWGSKGTSAAQFLDYDDDGLLDLVLFSAGGTRMLRNLGTRWEDVSAAALGTSASIGSVAAATADLDGDGDTDLLLRTTTGELRYLRNDGGNRNVSIRVRLAGLVSNRSGIGAKVELRAGSLFQKLETYAATPAVAPSDVVLGLGRRTSADAVRVIWPSGTVQTELGTGAPAPPAKLALFDVKELNRKPSSCPYLYAWNGQAFEFITDFMGGGEMGHLDEPGVWNRPDPLEYVRLTDQQLQARDGRFELRVTNELEEALFLDRLALVAITHRAGVEIYPHEGMTSPSKADRIYAVQNARVPARVLDDHGHDVQDLVARLDRRSPEDFGVLPIRGYAQEHALVLDLGTPATRSVLLLTGWTDYAWSSDTVAGAQAGLTLHAPSLQVEDAAGRWVNAIEQIGMPVGRPQTVVTDLAGIWRGPSRRVRILTNMRIHWDQIRVADVVDTTPASRTLRPSRARLRERGFSLEPASDSREPFAYDYAHVSSVFPWKEFGGRYTRLGDVEELLDKTDDVFAISRPGDEIAVEFDARVLGALPKGWTRTFLLLADGFSKEMDINSATPDQLGPLPFHAMTRYPYAAPEAFPMTPERERLFAKYNTRVVARPLRSLDVARLDGK
jgi:Flp pilus assembly protein TadD